MDDKKMIAVAEITGAHGIEGGIRIRPFNLDSPVFQPGASLFRKVNEKFIEHEITEVVMLPKGMRLHLSGLDDRDTAKSLFKSYLFLPHDQLPDIGEHENYVADLLGMKVIDEESGKEYGEISNVFETGAHDCYEVKSGKHEIIIPATRETILSVDLENKVVKVKLPEGLIEIYED